MPEEIFVDNQSWLDARTKLNTLAEDVNSKLSDSDILTDSGVIKPTLILSKADAIDNSYEVLNYSNNISISYDRARPNKKINLTGNANITIINTENGSSGLFELTQDNTGNRTITVNGTSIPINPIASKSTLIGWLFNGSTYSFDTNFSNALGPLTLAQLTAVLKQVPGFEEGQIKTLVYTGSSFAFSTITGGQVETQLATPVMSFGTPTGASVPVNWLAVPSATGYILKRNTVDTIEGAVTIYTGNLLTFTDTTLSPNSTYYYYLIATANGYISSDVNEGSATTTGQLPAENLLTVSNDFNANPPWHKQDVAFDTGGDLEGELAPDGTTNMFHLKPFSTVGGFDYQAGNTTLVIGNIYTLSIYVKKSDIISTLNLIVMDGDKGNVTYDLETGTVTQNNVNGVGAIQDVSSLGSGYADWYRISLTFTCNNTGFIFGYSVANPSNVQNGPYFWRAMLNEGDAAGIYSETSL